jgi:Dyp-type peroxidase family
MPVNLSEPLRWKSASADELAMLKDLQANILKGHGRSHTINLFLQFDPVNAAQIKVFLHKLKVTDAFTQLTDNINFKATRKSGGLVTLCLLSAAGYKALGVSSKAPTDAAFQAGMQARQSMLNDPPKQKWDRHFREKIHAMILLADDTPKMVKQAKIKLLASLPIGISITGEEVGLGMKSLLSPEEGIEHFGYVDGRSQPLMLEEDIENERDKRDGISTWSPKFGLNTALVKDPAASASTSFGSYFVFRKLEQDVKRFKSAEIKLAKALGLKGEDQERAGAMIVGRFEDGTPVVIQNEDGYNSPVPNNFNYKDDPTGAKCPFHGHIRKSNPRGESVAPNLVTEAQERSHIMARRGITYGTRKKHPNSKTLKISEMPTKEVGLLFMAYQSSIENQFEFTQATWVNNPDFVSPIFVPGGPVTGIDPIIGQGSNGGPAPKLGQTCPVSWGGGANAPRKQFDFQGFVKMLGGEYFFAPSLSALKTL